MCLESKFIDKELKIFNYKTSIVMKKVSITGYTALYDVFDKSGKSRLIGQRFKRVFRCYDKVIYGKDKPIESESFDKDSDKIEQVTEIKLKKKRNLKLLITCYFTSS